VWLGLPNSSINKEINFNFVEGSCNVESISSHPHPTLFCGDKEFDSWRISSNELVNAGVDRTACPLMQFRRYRTFGHGARADSLSNRKVIFAIAGAIAVFPTFVATLS
jgi:hypothetical protein